MSQKETTWKHLAFDCPVHGMEMEVLCFRAHDPSLVTQWKHLSITSRDTTEAEQKRIIAKIKETR